MAEPGDGARLALEACFSIRILGQMRREHLDRDRALEPRVARLVHLTHASGAQQTDDLKRAEARAGDQIHDYTSISSVAVESDGRAWPAMNTRIALPILMLS